MCVVRTLLGREPMRDDGKVLDEWLCVVDFRLCLRAAMEDLGRLGRGKHNIAEAYESV